MAEKEQKNKSGIGKFFLGAAIGAAAGAAAAKFIHLKTSCSEKELEDSIADASDSFADDDYDDDDDEPVAKVSKPAKVAKAEKKEKKETKKKADKTEPSKS